MTWASACRRANATSDSQAATDWDSTVERTCAEAAHAARSVRGVASAAFEIAGGEDAPRLLAHVRVSPRADLGGTVGRVVDAIVPGMERAIGTPFADRRIEFAYSERHHPRHPSSAEPGQVLTIV